jgi:hypothetical protein
MNQPQYPLKYHDSGDVAHYLIELVAARKAKSDGILLEKYFWREPVWQNYYKTQMRVVRKLLNLYDEDIVVSTLTEMKTVWSMSPSFVSDEMVRKNALRLKRKEVDEKRVEQASKVIEVDDTEIVQTRRRVRRKNNEST